MDFHLRPADAQGAITNDAVALFSLVGGLNAGDSQRWHRIQVNDHAQAWAASADLDSRQDL